MPRGARTRRAPDGARALGLHERHRLAHGAVGGLDAQPGAQRPEQIERLAGGERLDRHHRAGVADDGAGLAGGDRTHRDMVLLPRLGRDRVDRRGMAQDLVLGNQGGGRDLRHHQARVDPGALREEGGEPAEGRVHQALQSPLRDRRDLGGGDRQDVEGEGRRLAVEIAARHQVPVVGEEDRVVGHGVHLGLEERVREADSLPRRAVDLRHAAQGVGVLDPPAPLVGLVDLARLQQQAQVGGRGRLSGVGPQRLQPRIEGVVAPLERLERAGARDVGGGRQRLRLQERERPDREDHLGAVDQRQPFLRLQPEGLDPDPAQGVGRRHPRAAQPHLPLSDEAERQVRQRRQVAAGADRALLRDDRQEVGVQEVQERLDDPRPHTRVAARQDMGSQQHQGARRLGRERRSDAGAVAADQIQLQRLELIMRDAHVLEVAEAGVDSVDLLAAREDPLHQGVRPLHPPPRIRGEADVGPAAGDRRDLLKPQSLAVQDDAGHGRGPRPGACQRVAGNASLAHGSRGHNRVPDRCLLS